MKTRSVVHIVFVLVLCTRAVCANDRTTPIYVSGGESVSISGRLSDRTEWGPPNFGEDPTKDSRIKIWYLKLPEAKSFHVNSPTQNVQISLDEIQLVGGLKIEYRKLLEANINKIVDIKGKLWPATSAGDYSAIVIVPEEIETSKEDLN